jgi:hypothetical protein
MRTKLPLFAGFAKADITPLAPEGMDLFGMPRRFHGARGILNPLFARACYLESGRARFLLIEVDIVLIKSEFISPELDVFANYDIILKSLSRTTGVKQENIWLCATHCHSAVGESKAHANPYITKALYRYIDLLTERLVQAGTAAYQRKQRVKIGYSQGEVDNVAGNRRVKLADGTVITGWADGPSPPPGIRIVDRGLVDKNVGLIAFQSMRGRPLGAIVNYNSHIHSYPMLYFSPELAGAVAQGLEKKLPGLTAVYTNGAEGNTSLCANLPPQSPDPRQWNQQYLRERKRMSDIMVQKIVELYQGLKFESLVTMDTAQTVLLIPFRRQGKGSALRPLGKAREPMAAVTINDLALVSNPEEIFVEFALGVKQGSPFKSTFVVGMQGQRNFYFPTTHALEEGGYEAYQWMKPGSFERTTAAAVGLLKKMRRNT